VRSILQIGSHGVEVDVAATAACYARVSQPGPESCGCAHCRNWVAARHLVVSEELRRLLASLGIPDNGEINVAEYTGMRKPHGYIGWYFFVGRVVRGTLGVVANEFKVGDVSLHLSADHFFFAPEFADQEICQLNFCTEVDEFLTPADYQ